MLGQDSKNLRYNSIENQHEEHSSKFIKDWWNKSMLIYVLFVSTCLIQQSKRRMID